MNPILMAGAAGGPDIAVQVITTIVTFVLVLVTLKLVAWKPVIGLIDERRAAIAKEWEDIDRRKAEAEALRKEYAEKLRHIDDEARERLNKAVDDGRHMAEELIAKARHDSEEITEKARAAMELEVEKARLQLRREVVELTLQATGKLLDTTMDDARHRQLVDQFITEVASREG